MMSPTRATHCSHTHTRPATSLTLRSTPSPSTTPRGLPSGIPETTPASCHSHTLAVGGNPFSAAAPSALLLRLALVLLGPLVATAAPVSPCQRHGAPGVMVGVQPGQRPGLQRRGGGCGGGCGDGGGPLFNISSVQVSPDPPKRSKESTIIVSGNLQLPDGATLDSGDLHVSVFYSRFKVFSTQGPLCEAAPCPVPPGPTSFRFPLTMPSMSPPGRYSLRLKASTNLQLTADAAAAVTADETDRQLQGSSTAAASGAGASEAVGGARRMSAGLAGQQGGSSNGKVEAMQGGGGGGKGGHGMRGPGGAAAPFSSLTLARLGVPAAVAGGAGSGSDSGGGSSSSSSSSGGDDGGTNGSGGAFKGLNAEQQVFCVDVTFAM